MYHFLKPLKLTQELSQKMSYSNELWYGSCFLPFLAELYISELLEHNLFFSRNLAIHLHWTLVIFFVWIVRYFKYYKCQVQKCWSTFLRKKIRCPQIFQKVAHPPPPLFATFWKLLQNWSRWTKDDYSKASLFLF